MYTLTAIRLHVISPPESECLNMSNKVAQIHLEHRHRSGRLIDKVIVTYLPMLILERVVVYALPWE